MRYLVHLYARGDTPAFAGEYDNEREAVTAIRARYPRMFGGPPIYDGAEAYLLVFPDYDLVALDTPHTTDGQLAGLVPCGRVVAIREDTEMLADFVVPFDGTLWLPSHLLSDILAAAAGGRPRDELS